MTEAAGHEGQGKVLHMDPICDGKYVGAELDLFSSVRNWKAYWGRQVQAHMRGDVLEVGAGIGSNTAALAVRDLGRWVCLEPDPDFCGKLRENLLNIKEAGSYEVVCGNLSNVRGQSFDTIIYIDVLEHIADDRKELVDAAALLRPRGQLIVLSPAYNFLYSPFDAAIGHYRRYDRAMLRNISPDTLATVSMRYLDCAGSALSAANKLLLRQSMPTKSQLQFWDRWVIPVSRVLDRFIGFSMGKTIIAVWRKPGD